MFSHCWSMSRTEWNVQTSFRCARKVRKKNLASNYRPVSLTSKVKEETALQITSGARTDHERTPWKYDQQFMFNKIAKIPRGNLKAYVFMLYTDSEENLIMFSITDRWSPSLLMRQSVAAPEVWLWLWVWPASCLTALVVSLKELYWSWHIPLYLVLSIMRMYLPCSKLLMLKKMYPPCYRLLMKNLCTMLETTNIQKCM